MSRHLKNFIGGTAVVFAGLHTAVHAVECQDPAWTQAITEAMGRAPKAGECNAKLYGVAEAHQDKVRVVRKTLGRVYQRRGGNDVPTQQLPLTAQPGR